MIKISEKISPMELANVIRSLISFIVMEGKEMVEESKKDEYIKHYLYHLSRSMNGVTEIVDIDAVSKVIEKDIKKHYKNKEAS